jgi:alanine racemase
MLENALTEYDDIAPIGIHLKMDTGMHRLGFDEDDLKMLIGRLQGLQDHLYIRSVFSHLAAAEDELEDEFTNSQINKLSKMADEIQLTFNYPIMKHILNTSGITRFKNAQFDMVRLGIGMYGIPTCKEDENALENVCTLRTSISQIKTIPQGESVGYSRSWIAPKDTPIGIIPVGYADGLNRAYGNGVGKVLVNGKLAPIIGIVCMDMCMIDLTKIEANVGDKVIVFGDEYPVEIMSKSLNTISYEVLTGISRRVKRVYYQE